VPELAELIFALRLEPGRQDAVITGLDLTAEDEAALQSHIADLALYFVILSDWAFLNSSDPAGLAALLNVRGLTVEQLVQFLQRTGLSAPELEVVLGGLDLSTADLTEVVEQLGVDMPATRTPTPTAEGTPATVTPTAGSAITGTASVTPSATISVTLTLPAGEAPDGTPTPAAYLGEEPDGTPIPDAYPGEEPDGTTTPDAYPGAVPDATATPGSYPGDEPTATAAFLSSASCVGDNLQVTAQETAWIDAAITVRSDEGVLFSGTTGPAGEPVEETASGPATWTNLRIESSVAPTLVSLGTFTCPLP
jgi:hypothetical protein